MDEALNILDLAAILLQNEDFGYGFIVGILMGAIAFKGVYLYKLLKNDTTYDTA
jgi:hypothetical protein